MRPGLFHKTIRLDLSLATAVSEGINNDLHCIAQQSTTTNPVASKHVCMHVYTARDMLHYMNGPHKCVHRTSHDCSGKRQSDPGLHHGLWCIPNGAGLIFTAGSCSVAGMLSPPACKGAGPQLPDTAQGESDWSFRQQAPPVRARCTDPSLGTDSG